MPFNHYRGRGLNTPEFDTLNFTVFTDPYNPKASVIASGKWLTVRKTSQETGHSGGRLRTIAREGLVKSALVDGRWYIFEEDVNNLKPPEGHWSLDKAMAYSGLGGDQIKRLRREGIVKGTIRHNQVYVDEISFRGYVDPPLGYLPREEAKDFLECATKRPLERLVKAGVVATKEKRGRKFYSIEDLRIYKGVPEGYISVRQGTNKFPYDEAEIKAIAAKNGFQIIQSGNVIYIPETGLEEYIGEKKLEEVVIGLFDEEAPKHSSTEEVAMAIARRLGIRSDGNHTNGINGGSNQHNGNIATLELIAKVVKSFE